MGLLVCSHDHFTRSSVFRITESSFSFIAASNHLIVSRKAEQDRGRAPIERKLVVRGPPESPEFEATQPLRLMSYLGSYWKIWSLPSTTKTSRYVSVT